MLLLATNTLHITDNFIYNTQLYYIHTVVAIYNLNNHYTSVAISNQCLPVKHDILHDNNICSIITVLK